MAFSNDRSAAWSGVLWRALGGNGDSRIDDGRIKGAMCGRFRSLFFKDLQGDFARCAEFPHLAILQVHELIQ
jgi:hypothetical protein